VLNSHRAVDICSAPATAVGGLDSRSPGDAVPKPKPRLESGQWRWAKPGIPSEVIVKILIAGGIEPARQVRNVGIFNTAGKLLGFRLSRW